MKKHILLLLLLAPCFTSPLWAQSYVVSSVATPGAATFKSDKIVDGVISLPFVATTEAIPIETNQDATVSSDAEWCQATYADGTLTLTVTQNDTEDARTAILAVRSKDFRPLPITVRQESRLAFAVISDTHVGNTWGAGYKVKIPQALQNLTRHGKLDAMAVVGDLTDNGRADQYKEFVQFFGSEQNLLSPVGNFLFMMGNHDNFDTGGQTNYRNGLKAFNGGRSYPLDQYVLIKGYPFISISQRSSANNDDNAGNGTASYPSTVVTTLKRYLRQAVTDAPGKPIFIFTHVAPRWTCYSSWGEIEGIAWAMKVLNPVLNEYPQAIVFCGHSHYPLGDPRSIHQGANPNSTRNNYYTVVNTASTTYSEINPGAVAAGIHPEGYAYVTEGMIVEEQPNGDIEIRRYDTYRDVEIDPEHRWVVKAPFDGSMFQYADIRDADDNPNNITLRDGLPAPVFANDAKLTLKASPSAVKVSFPQATDNECVFRYKIRVLQGKTEVKSAFVFSQFYLTTDMPQSLSYTVDGLSENTEYNVEVIAYDSYDNQSQPLTATVTIPADDAPAPEPVGCWTFDNPDNLLAGTGIATLQGAAHSKGSVRVTDDLGSIGIKAVSGPTDDNGAISVPVKSSLYMTTNLEEKSLSDYTLLMDIHVKELNDYTALYQNDPTNSKDGSFFIKNGALGLNSNGLGYGGTLSSEKWHRVLFVVRENAVTIYLDGYQVGQSTSGNATIWQMKEAALFFADESGEEHLVEASEIRFWDVALTKGQATKLGSVIPNDEPVALPDPIGCWTFDDSNDLLAGTGIATIQGTKHAKGSVTAVDKLADANIVPVDGPSTSNKALSVPVGSSLLMASNLNVTTMDTYSIMWDIKAADLSTYVPLLQNDLTNTKDGSLFLNQNKVGLNGTHSLGYKGYIANNKWSRIVFVVKDGYGATYVDGVKVGQSIMANTQHWQLTTGALFFADNDGEEKAIQTAEIRFWNVALSDAEVGELGTIGKE